MKLRSGSGPLIFFHRPLFLLWIAAATGLTSGSAKAALAPKFVGKIGAAIAEICLKAIVATANLRPVIKVNRDNSLLSDLNRTGIVQDLLRQFPELRNKRSYLLSLNRMAKKEGRYTIGREHPWLRFFGPMVAIEIYTGNSGWGYPFILQLEPGDGGIVSVNDLKHYFEWAAKRVGIDLDTAKPEVIERDYHNDGLLVHLPPGTSATKAVAALELLDPLILPASFRENYLRNVHGLVQYADPKNPRLMIGKLSLNQRESVEIGGIPHFTARIRDRDFYKSLHWVVLDLIPWTNTYRVVFADKNKIRIETPSGKNGLIHYRRLDAEENSDGWLYGFAFENLLTQGTLF